MTTYAYLALAFTGLVLTTAGCSSKQERTYSKYVATDGTGGSTFTGADASSCKTGTGYEQVSAPDAHALTDDGHIALVLDGQANPMVTWVTFDQTAPTLYFSAYDSSTCEWLPKIAIEGVGGVSATHDRQVTMARDPENGQLAIAYQTIDASSNRALKLAQSSDNGVTWTAETVVQSPSNDTTNGVSRPTVAIQAGVTYFAYYQTYLYSKFGEHSSDNGGFVLLSRSGTSGTFTSVNVPPVEGATLAGSEDLPPSLALKSDGTAGLAYFALADDTAMTLRVVYYEAGAAQSVVAFDSLAQVNTSADVSLVFVGDKAHLAASLQRGTSDASNSKIWFSRSDDGVAWTTPAELPRDGDDDMGPDLALAAATDGTLSVASNYGSGTTTLHQCAAPKLSTSSDDGATWTTCGPALTSAGQVTYAGRYVQLQLTPSGKRIAAFAAQRLGVWVWREP